MKKIKEIVLVAGLVIFSGICFSGNVGAIRCPSDSVRSGDNVESLAECNVSKASTSGESETLRLAKDVINFLVPVAGLAALAAVVAAGYMITTSAGDAGKVKKGKTVMMWGIIGMVITLFAYAIVNFVLSNVF
ncbi:MAG: hypothetical protein Q4F60_00670 [Candidatus Saccharibacteria bacterium]|nr:hypothetical protein [Candidatus Saccharibacteria bacterium]